MSATQTQTAPAATVAPAATAPDLSRIMEPATAKGIAMAVGEAIASHQSGLDRIEGNLLENVVETFEPFASAHTVAHGVTGAELDALMGKALTEALKLRGVRDVKGYKSKIRTSALVFLNAPAPVINDAGKVVPWEHAPKKREGFNAYVERARAVLPTLKTADGRPVVPTDADGNRTGAGTGGATGGATGDAQGSGGNTSAGSGASANPAKAAKEARENAAATLMGDAKAAAALLAWLESPEGKAVVAKLKQA